MNTNLSLINDFRCTLFIISNPLKRYKVITKISHNDKFSVSSNKTKNTDINIDGLIKLLNHQKFFLTTTLQNIKQTENIDNNVIYTWNHFQDNVLYQAREINNLYIITVLLQQGTNKYGLDSKKVHFLLTEVLRGYRFALHKSINKNILINYTIFFTRIVIIKKFDRITNLSIVKESFNSNTHNITYNTSLYTSIEKHNLPIINLLTGNIVKKGLQNSEIKTFLSLTKEKRDRKFFKAIKKVPEEIAS